MLAKAAAKHPEKYPGFNRFALLSVDNINDSDSIPVPVSTLLQESRGPVSAPVPRKPTPKKARFGQDLPRNTAPSPVATSVPLPRDSTPTLPRADSTPPLPTMYDSVSACRISEISPGANHFRIQTQLNGSRVRAMLDSGATGLFINKRYADRLHIPVQRLQQQLPLYNIDGSDNRAGTITHFARLRLEVGQHDKEWDFLITDLGPEDVILGLPWLREANPQIDWKEGILDVEAARRPQKVDANRKARRA